MEAILRQCVHHFSNNVALFILESSDNRPDFSLRVLPATNDDMYLSQNKHTSAKTFYYSIQRIFYPYVKDTIASTCHFLTNLNHMPELV